jgi:hypothetical protein
MGQYHRRDLQQRDRETGWKNLEAGKTLPKIIGISCEHGSQEHQELSSRRRVSLLSSVPMQRVNVLRPALVEAKNAQ